MVENVVLSYVLPAVFLLSGLGLLIGGWTAGAKTRAFLGRAVQTQGEVVDLEEEPAMDAGDAKTYRPVVTYVLPSGQRVKFKSLVHSNPPAYEVGEKVVVLYETTRPHEARIRSFDSLWLLAVILGGLGMVFSVVGAGLLVGGMLR